MSEKPVVHYDTNEFHQIMVGSRAMVKPINHPNPFGLVSNTKLVFTSTVLQHDLATGVFETENTKYVPQS